MKKRKGEVSGYVTAPSTYEGQKYGYVFDHCRFTGDCPDGSAYLGRPWRKYAKCVIMHSEIGAHIRKEGWHDWATRKPQRTHAKMSLVFREEDINAVWYSVT